jgi:soluble cytochrome b562
MNDVFGHPNKAAPRHSNEKVYRRQTLGEWDSRWHRLSSLARYFVLHHVTLRTSSPAFRSTAPDVSISTFPPGVVEELSHGGFVKIVPGTRNGVRDRVVASDGLHEFAARAHTLRRYHLLADDQPSELAAYVDRVYFVDQLMEVLSGVLRKAGIECPARLHDLLNRYVLDHHWPAWVARSLNEPLADRILDVVRKGAGPIPVAELPARIAGSDPNKVCAVVDKLVARLALAEDIRSSRWELMVGLLPAVREKMTLAAMPRERPPLLECPSPRELGPDGSPVVNDLRAVLLEVASQPPRLRQDQTLFHKEIERFQTALDPLAEWLLDAMKWSAEGRLNRAVAWARALELANVEPAGEHIRLHLSPLGLEWLSGGALEDHLKIDNALSTFEPHSELYSPHLGLYSPGLYPFDIAGPSDVRFLGTHVTSLKVEKGKHPSHFWGAKPDDLLALRNQLDSALSVLKPGVFYRLDSIESHLVFAEHNPLNRGLPAEQVAVFWVSRPVPAARPQREEVGRRVVNTFVLERLLPFGCVRAAIDDDGRICIARGPRFDAFFGREIARSKLTPRLDVAARVVVQPDFSLVIIGTNAAPAAALAPLCERTTRGGSQGALVLKLTRESVVKAVKNGLKPQEIVARLTRHASNEVPANVLRQVQEWSTWVRRVTSSSLVALRCPDSDTADRVMAAMKRQAERVSSTLVAIDRNKLTTTDRNKLEDHGILVEDEPGNPANRLKSRKK